MVTFLVPENRRVSIWARMTVSWPGARLFCNAWAEVQPQETRTLLMVIGPLVLLTMWKGWTRVGPRGTVPKSRDRSSNNASAQLEAEAEPVQTRPSASTRQYRIIVGWFPAAQEAPGVPG